MGIITPGPKEFIHQSCKLLQKQDANSGLSFSKAHPLLSYIPYIATGSESNGECGANRKHRLCNFISNDFAVHTQKSLVREPANSVLYSLSSQTNTISQNSPNCLCFLKPIITTEQPDSQQILFMFICIYLLLVNIMCWRLLTQLSLILTTSGKGTRLVSPRTTPATWLNAFTEAQPLCPKVSPSLAGMFRNATTIFTFLLFRKTNIQDEGEKTEQVTPVIFGLLKPKDYHLNHCASSFLLINILINCQVQRWYEDSLIYPEIEIHQTPFC